MLSRKQGEKETKLQCQRGCINGNFRLLNSYSLIFINYYFIINNFYQLVVDEVYKTHINFDELSPKFIGVTKNSHILRSGSC